jgi:hypothetical protein
MKDDVVSPKKEKDERKAIRLTERTRSEEHVRHEK